MKQQAEFLGGHALHQPIQGFLVIGIPIVADANQGDLASGGGQAQHFLIQNLHAQVGEQLAHTGRVFHRTVHGIDAQGGVQLPDQRPQAGHGLLVLQVGQVEEVAGEDDDVGL